MKNIAPQVQEMHVTDAVQNPAYVLTITYVNNQLMEHSWYYGTTPFVLAS